jgi:hypothetical protein
MTFLKVDNAVPNEIVSQLEATEPITRARQVVL